MARNEVEILLNVRLDVPTDTVRSCLGLIEQWLNADATRKISGGTRHADGKVEPFKIYDGE